MKPIVIRPGERMDLPQTLELIRELAKYERAEHEVTNTLEQMEKDGFGQQPIFDFFVAVEDSHIIGISIFYYRYSTWKGKRLYLEDIVVTESRRSRGVGKMLFEHTMKKSLTENCSGAMWQVLKWNEPAINFYKKYGARLDNEWTNCTLEAGQIMKLLNH